MHNLTLPRRGFLPSLSLGKFGTFLKRYGLFSLFLLTLSAMAAAGTDTTFDGINNVIKGWMTGSLGKLFGVTAFVIGMGIALVRQSVLAIVVGIGVGLLMFCEPSIIDGWVTGFLGKLFAVAALVTGMGIGLVRQSMVALVIGIGMGLVMFYGPSIIVSIVTAAI